MIQSEPRNLVKAISRKTKRGSGSGNPESWVQARRLSVLGREIVDKQPPKDWIERAFTPSAEAAWRIEQEGYEPACERQVESRFAVSNGLLGVRGSPDLPTVESLPRTYVAGLFDRPKRPFGETEAEADSIPVLIPAPDWLTLRILVDGEEVSLDGGALRSNARSICSEAYF